MRFVEQIFKGTGKIERVIVKKLNKLISEPRAGFKSILEKGVNGTIVIASLYVPVACILSQSKETFLDINSD